MSKCLYTRVYTCLTHLIFDYFDSDLDARIVLERLLAPDIEADRGIKL